MDSFSSYLNGRWVPGPELCVHVDDIGFLVGATVTERLRTFHGELFRLDEHLHRMRRSLDIVGMPTDSIIDQVTKAIPEFVDRNREQIDEADDWSVVAFATPGRDGAGQPTVCVHGHPLPFHRWAAQFETGIPVTISSVRQVPSECWPAELKCRSRMHYYLADREAAARRPGAKPVLLDEDGNIAEGTTANVITYRSGEGFVSPPSDHILFGVSLQVVQELAARLNVPFVTRPVSVEDFHSADEAMFTSTSICVLPIVECDGRKFGDGQPGPRYRELLAAWSDLVGVDVADQARRYAKRGG